MSKINCPFCRILKENTERIIKETAHTIVVLSNPKLVSGHLLIIPKRHVEKFSELSAREGSDLFNTTIAFQEKILETIASGCDMTQHFRPFIKQNRLKVNHLHIHLRPREFEDELYKKVQKHEAEIFTDLGKEEFEKYKKLFAC